MCMSFFLPLWVVSLVDGCDSGPKVVNRGCVKRKQANKKKKRGGGEKEGAKRADACNILCI